MNFQDLYKKIASLDTPVSENFVAQDKKTGQQWTLDGGPNTPVDPDDMPLPECGDMPMPAAPKQSDSVTMNVSMNGSGAGGIKDLMAILRNIESGATSDHSHGADKLFTEPSELSDDFANGQNTTTLNIDAVTPTGDDLASKGAEAEKVNGGGNPMGVDESLVDRLTRHYQSIKESR